MPESASAFATKSGETNQLMYFVILIALIIMVSIFLIMRAKPQLKVEGFDGVSEEVYAALKKKDDDYGLGQDIDYDDSEEAEADEDPDDKEGQLRK
jgi:hypothetical protein